MRYLVTVTFLLFLISNIYILHMNKKATVKRMAFRWWLILFAVFSITNLAFGIADKVLLLLFLPVLAVVLVGWYRFTKFCDWCGRMVKTNLPFASSNRCPRCSSSIS
jgi:hypothetical protein